MNICKENGTVYENPLLSMSWLCKDHEGKAVGNFFPVVLSLIEIKGTGQNKCLVHLKLCFSNDEIGEAVIPLEDLDKVKWFDIDKRCIINSDYRNAKKYIANIIRCGLNKASKEVRYEFDKTGVEHIDGKIVFLAGDRVLTRSSDQGSLPDIKLKNRLFRLDIDEKLNAQEAFKGMRELICLSSEIGRILVAHVVSGITRAAFKKVGFTPCAVLVVVGESGMLKSHYVPQMTQLYNRNDGIKAITRFNSSMSYIEGILYEHSECTAVIDDLHTAESKGIKRRNEATVEEIIRRVSDDTGRGHKEGNALIQKEFRGNVIFIGEYIVGKESTIPRALVVSLTKRPDGRKLDIYQRQQPLVVSTFYYFFIQWYVEHFDDVCREISTELTKLREESMDWNIHGRLCDTQFYLQISYRFFLEFCIDSSFFSTEQAANEYKKFKSQIAGLIRAQQDRYKLRDEKVEGVNYLKLIRKLYQSKSFDLAKSKEQFDPDKHDGLYYYERCICLRGESLDRKICKIIPGAKRSDIVKDLLAKDALKLVGTKNSVQINGLRFYAIKLDKLG